MSETIEVKVPDIGDYKDVPVIEVFVKPGDTVGAEDSLITIESDKATMEVPAPSAGVVKELRVKVGDKVSQGSPVLVLEAQVPKGSEPAPAKAEKPATPPKYRMRAPERQKRDRDGEAFVPRGLQAEALRHPGRRLLRVAEAGGEEAALLLPHA